MLFGDTPVVSKDSPLGQLVERMEREWKQVWDATPLAARSAHPEAVEAFKRFFMVGFATGAKWAQGKGIN